MRKVAVYGASALLVVSSIVGISYALAKSARAHKLIDSDLIAALSSMAKTYETLTNSGLHYEVPNTSVMQQSIVAEVQTMLKEYRETEQQHLGYTRLRDGDILRALVFLVRMGLGRTSGRPKTKAFVDFLFAQFPDEPAAAALGEPASRIILP